jgi:hypothetical protein
MRRYATNYGTGKVHLGEPSRRAGWYTILFCTGRAVSGAVATTDAPTCKACLKRAKANGVDPTEET